MPNPVLTIAIPTYNRAAFVETAVNSLRQQSNAGERWRVIVVNNNSSDDTAERLAKAASVWPRLKVLFEPEAGASAARNCAVHACSNGYILFADDECKFPPNYVDRALALIDQHAPNMFGGPILPWYVETPPAWFWPEYGSYSLDKGDGSRYTFLSGGNMGFSVEALRSIGGFNVARGPQGEKLSFGEETEVELRMLKKFGLGAVWFDPGLFNFHAVRPEKFRWRNLVREHFLRGCARADLKHFGTADVAISGAAHRVTMFDAPPVADVSRPAFGWQNLAYEYGLGIVRKLGTGWTLARNRIRGRLPTRGNGTINSSSEA